MYTLLVKPFCDRVTALVGLILLSPIVLLVALILWLSQRGSPIFTQVRPGFKKRYFRLIKFRTMNNKRDTAGNLLPDEHRLTQMGRFIRKTSLDELPQLINVLKGDMSLVGPRPLLVEYLPLYSKEQARRHDVKPGITGWAQVNGRNAISWEEKFRLDVWYVDNQSFLLDLKILGLTILKVFKSEGITQEGKATVEYFKGNER